MRTIIIDDEKNARDTIRSMLEALADDVNIVAEADGVATGKKAIEKYKPDFVVLDIRMKDGTGFDMLRKLTHYNFALVFLTAHDDHALEAFRFSAVDYLLKPVDPGDLQRTIEKVRKQQTPTREVLNTLLENMQKFSGAARKIVLRTSEAIHFINSDDIIHCESADNYTRFFIRERKPLMISQSLKTFEEILEPLGFLRIHQSHLINLRHICKVDRKGGFQVEMTDGSMIPVAVRKKEMLLNRLAGL
jgi:two-component system LytT family response regulator